MRKLLSACVMTALAASFAAAIGGRSLLARPDAPPGRPAPAPVYRVATFDSGFGGYFTAKEIERQARSLSADGYGPFEVAHYGDTTNVPYGEKTPEEIARFASAGILAAFHDGAAEVYIACNTASTQFDRIREILRAEKPAYATHTYSIVDSSVREVMKTVSRTLKTEAVATVAVMATPATARSETYPKALARALGVAPAPAEFTTFPQARWLASKGASITSLASVTELALGPEKRVIVYQFSPANWVEMIENGAPEAEKREAVRRDLARLTGRMRPGDRIDVVGEFCTHYPVFDAMIRQEFTALGKTAAGAPFVVQGPLMGQLFRSQFLQRKPPRAAGAVPAPGTPPFYMSGTNIEPIRALVRAIFPGDPEPRIEHREFALPK
jgi:glutamate racemase